VKIGAKVHYFNYEMRKRRKELGWSQVRLAEESGVNLWALGLIERLGQPVAGIDTVNGYLLSIARALGLDFGVLFPPEYLDLLQRELLPRRRTSYLWVSELSLERLPETTRELLVPGADQVVMEAEMCEAVRAAVETLPVREARVLEMRFGLGGGERLTMEETGAELGITRERVRQIQGKGLRRLQHPARSRPLREHLV